MKTASHSTACHAEKHLVANFLLATLLLAAPLLLVACGDSGSHGTDPVEE
jgi:hypothetical protein